MEYGFRSFEVDSSAFEPAVKASELRLGNWLQSYSVWLIGDKSEKHIIGPFQVDIKTLEMLSGPNSLMCTMEPVLLTYEMLEGCGFVKTNGFIWDTENGGIADIYDKGGFRIHVDVSKGLFYTTQPKSIDYKYVHQLQNLYFALTSTELEIKL